MLAKDALNIINRFGRTVTLRKPTLGAYDPSLGTASSVTNEDYEVVCFFADFNLSEIDNDNIYLGDRKAYLPSTDTSGNPLPLPDATDTLIGAGDDAKIVKVQEMWDRETRVCFICQVRA